MDILVLSHLYPRKSNPLLGVFIHEQVRGLLAKGFNVKVLSGEPFWVNTLNPIRIFRALQLYRASETVWSSYDGVQVCFFPYVTGWISPFEAHSYTYARGAARAVARLGIGKPDLVHAHTAFLDGCAARMFLQKRDWTYLLTEHTGPFSLLTRNLLRRQRTRSAIVDAKQVLAVSPALKREMETQLSLAGEVDIQAIPNGVDSSVFLPQRRTRKKDCVRGLWVGHHVTVKRVDNLIRAFAVAYRSNASLRLTLVGDGVLKSGAVDLVQQLGVASVCQLLPAMDRTGVAKTMAEHDFLVISSDTETFGVVAIEAMSCGIPVLSTRCGGPESIITEQVSGLLVDKDETSLAQGLLKMAQLISQGAFDADQIRERALAQFSEDIVVDTLGRYYHSATA